MLDITDAAPVKCGVMHHDAQLFREMIVEIMEMKTSTPLIILASLTLTFTGCSKHSQTASLPKNNDLGVVDISSGKPSRHLLADGRACTITPTSLPDGHVRLATTIDETNGSRKTLMFEAPVDGRAYTFGFDKSTVITVALRK